MGVGRATHIGLDDDPSYFGCICCGIRPHGEVRVLTFKNLRTDRENCAQNRGTQDPRGGEAKACVGKLRRRYNAFSMRG